MVQQEGELRPHRERALGAAPDGELPIGSPLGHTVVRVGVALIAGGRPEVAVAADVGLGETLVDTSAFRAVSATPATTAGTPGSAAAPRVATVSMRTCACGLRRPLPCRRRRSWTSAPYAARPVPLSPPSGRAGRVPIARYFFVSTAI